MAIESKNLLVWVKAMSRGQALPLDASEIYTSYAEAETYAASATAYAGQTIKALMEDGKYHSYTLQPTEAGYVLEEVGALKASDLKQYVVVDTKLPESGMEEGTLYINTTDKSGSVWTGTEWKEVFWDVDQDIADVAKDLEDLADVVDTKAPIANPVFSGVVKVGEEEVALKSYVEGLFANLEEKCATPGIVDAENALPTTGYKAGQTFRVAAKGTYAGVKCEPGDLILVVKDHAEGTASNDDFMVLQANIDGAVTSAADVSTVGEIVVFDSVTGKVIKGAGVQIASLNDAIAKAHEHANKTVLDSYDKTQAEVLAAAKSEAQGLVDALQGTVNTALDNKADKATTLAGYGITDAYTTTVIDGKLQTITENLNTKASTTEVEGKIATAKSETLEEAAEAAAEALEARVGGIPETDTIKEYIDRTASTGSADVAGAISEAKEQSIAAAKEYADAQDVIMLTNANAYTDTQLASALAVTEF